MSDSTQGYDEFQWNNDSIVAMLLIMQGRLTDEQIADCCGVSEATLLAWRCHPEFKAVYDKCGKHAEHLLTKGGMANRNRRIAQLGEHWERFVTIFDDCAKDSGAHSVPGMQTGLMRKTYRVSSTYEAVEYFMDTTSVREQRAIAEKAAKDLGDWSKKLEVTDVNGVIPIELVDQIMRDATRGLSPEELATCPDDDYL